MSCIGGLFAASVDVATMATTASARGGASGGARTALVRRNDIGKNTAKHKTLTGKNKTLLTGRKKQPNQSCALKIQGMGRVPPKVTKGKTQPKLRTILRGTQRRTNLPKQNKLLSAQERSNNLAEF